MGLIPNNIEKNTRDQFLGFVDITPNSTATFACVGIGVTEANIEYNPQIETEKWIIEKNARNEHTGNQKQLPINQKCYKNDPLFEYLNGLRDKINCISHYLEIDTWNGSLGNYPAKLSDCLITINSYSGEVIDYTISFNGDPTEGTSTLVDGVPTFTPSVSL